MNETQVLEKLQKLESAVARLQERIEDLEDLRDLEQAIAENGDKPLIPWEEAKKDLDLE
jgi:hypothetical protein